MSLTCPECGISGEFVSYTDNGHSELRRCRQCGSEYTIIIDVDDDPYPPDEPYSMDDIGYGTCANCGQQMDEGIVIDVWEHAPDGPSHTTTVCEACYEDLERPRGDELGFRPITDVDGETGRQP